VERIVETIAEHLAIVSILLEGNVDATERLFVLHLARSKAVVEANVDRAIARMIRGALS
jgi:DNA-binding GntR family transcriptional regulator